MSEIPSIKVLEAIKPTNSGTGEEKLAYKGLARAVKNYSSTNFERSSKFWNSEENSIEELSSAKQLASEYFLRTAEKLVDSREDNRDLWSDRFTQATIELYGEPEKEEVTQLIKDEYDLLLNLRGNEYVSQKHVNFLIETYKSILIENAYNKTSENSLEKEKEKEAIHKYGEVILSNYKPLFDLINESKNSEFNSRDLRDIFNKALDWLKENDDKDWGEWEVIDTDGTSLSVDASIRKIKIASNREPVNAKDARGLIAHELLVHALRGKNGYKTGDKKVATGLPGYLDAEEGLGILAEEAVNGELSEKAYDRYVDIALALGSIDSVQKTRQELFQISFARQLIREQLKGTVSEDNISSLERKVWVHIDRIYRGGRGDNSGTKQAIFTKDIAYYAGYKKMAEYISNQLASGKTANEVFDYLSQGKFDPYNTQHIERLSKK